MTGSFEEVFSAWWAVLCERFNRGPSQVLAAMYLDSLADRLTVEEFQEAATEIFERARYWPSPQDFVDAVEPDGRADAHDEWGTLLTVLRGSRGQLSDTARRAVELMGGERLLRLSPETELKWLRKDFVALHQELAEAERRELGRRRLEPPMDALLTQVVPDLLGDGGDR
jgi:hypothetical protein